ncbi:MAG: hypothetical protein K940chlam3_00874 [Chlamydiae bacterium]|nr:hypothetical protein [Chlamydiota bacterium]
MLEIREINQDPSYQASKWQQVRMLVDVDEIKDLFEELGDFFLFCLGGVLKQGEGSLDPQAFLTIYADYIQHLKEGKVLDKQVYMSSFSSAMTADLKALYAVNVGENKQIIRIRQPVIQMQEHIFNYSQDDQKFRSMVFGMDSITWGIQFSYPQLFTDPQSNEVKNVLQSDFPNSHLFRTLQKWVRRNTVPTPFIVDGKKVNVPIRLGKACLNWIQNHPQLTTQGVQVDVT